MTATKQTYVCAECGAESLRWEGRCASCGAWNAMVARPLPRRRGRAAPQQDSIAAPLGASSDSPAARIRSEVGELDLVLGGGLVPGSLVLLGGVPGIGKSTLLLQLAGQLAAMGRRVLYVSGEESADQVRLRARRLGGGTTEVLFLPSTDVDEVIDVAQRVDPAALCIDSIQTMSTNRLDSAPGTVSQVRESAAILQAYAKRAGAATLLVGHVTKGGALAGPRMLEHLVDVVLHFDGQRTLDHRILRASKNRFGSADEIAAFRMTSKGLEPVDDPSQLFLPERGAPVSGAAVALPVQGSRALVAEVQALATRARFATPQRVAPGFPPRRLALILAVLERRAGLQLADSDVFVNVVGGLRLADPGADLALVAALASAELDRPFPSASAFVGEVGLGGEIRGAGLAEQRVRAAERAAVGTVFVPVSLSGAGGGTGRVELRTLEHVREILDLLRDR